MTSILRCPVCRKPLSLSADGYLCPARHAFDVARQGYINLLPVHKKHSKEPGDDPAMVLSRRRFLDLGFYRPLSEAINATIGGLLSTAPPGSPYSLLDAGCGEGYYLQRLKAALGQCQADRLLDCYGVDVSKFAVRQATQRDRGMTWLVASINDLPFMDLSLDLVLSVFAPANLGEFARILKPGGALVFVCPGPRHLNGLREIIYPVSREHQESTITEKARELFTPAAGARSNYRLEFQNRQEITDLLAMTPYYWNIDQATQARVAALERLALDVEVEVRVFHKR